MAAKKQKQKRGPKPKYDMVLCHKVKLMARSGMFDRDMWQVIGISERTWYRWQNEHPEFEQAIKEGKEFSDSLIEDSIYKAAKGYEITTKNIIQEDILVGKDKEGKPITYTKTKKQITTKFVQPNVLAGIFILKTRQRDRWGYQGGGGQEIPVNPQLPGNGNTFTDKMLIARERLKARKEAYLAQLAGEKETAAMLQEAEVIDIETDSGVET